MILTTASIYVESVNLFIWVHIIPHHIDTKLIIALGAHRFRKIFCSWMPLLLNLNKRW